jgi:hypothetical protein
LQQEKKALSAKEDLLVKKFTLMRFGKRIVKAWRDITRLERVEREKQQYKQKMWSKVNTWLYDLDGPTKSPRDHTPATLSTLGQDANDNLISA